MVVELDGMVLGGAGLDHLWRKMLVVVVVEVDHVDHGHHFDNQFLVHHFYHTSVDHGCHGTDVVHSDDVLLDDGSDHVI